MAWTNAAARVMAVLTCAGLVAAMSGCGGSANASPQQQAAARFLARYARPDGQVVRLDQGGDTVSEGQAYGMLLAEVAGNTAAFGRIWAWAHEHLQLSNGLFAFHANAAGKVLSRQPASDADLLIAWALLRYRGPSAAAWHRDGRRVAAAVLAHELTTGPGGTPVLAAGPWATGRPASLDPSYWSLAAYQGLAQLTGDQSGVNITNPSQFSFVGFAVESASLTGDAGGALYLNFTPVPEPAAVLGLAALGLGLAAGLGRKARGVTRTVVRIVHSGRAFV